MLEVIFSDSVTWLDLVFAIIIALGFIILAYGIPYNTKVLRVIGWALVWTGGVYEAVRFVVDLFLK